MAIRTTKSKVTFAAPFSLPELDAACPAGTYELETDEEILEGLERTAYLRVATFLRVRNGQTHQTVAINPEHLAAALAADKEAASR